MTTSSDSNTNQKSADLQRQADKLRNDSLSLYQTGVSGIGLGGLYREVAKLQEKVFPADKTKTNSWAWGKVSQKAAAWGLMILGGIALVGGLVFERKAKQKNQEAQNAIPEPIANISQISEPSYEEKHVARYKKEVSASKKSL